MTSPQPHKIDMLFIDDKQDNYTAVRGRLNRWFWELHCDPDITFEADLDRACDTILARTRPFDVVVADLLHQPPGEPRSGPFEPRGLEVIVKARHASTKTVIVALTDGDDTQPELEDRAKESGAHIVLRRPNLLEQARYG